MIYVRFTQMVFIAIASVIAVLISSSGVAAEPSNWQMNMVSPASPVMEEIRGLYGYLTWMAVAIVLFVLGLLAYVCFRFSETRNPTPSKTTHNTVLEIVWTVIPVLILATFAVPSLKLLYFMDKTQEAEMTLKVVGHQWYWSYEYPDHGDFTFDATMLNDEELQPGQPRLLATDYAVVLPIDTNIRILMTSDDVIHAWALPALGIKNDTVPGRTNESWVRITKAGTYYGQCSELCGINHGFMPITINAVDKDEFTNWVEQAKVEFARDVPNPPERRTAALNMKGKGASE